MKLVFGWLRALIEYIQEIIELEREIPMDDDG